MLDIKLIRENPEMIKKDLLRRPKFDNSIVDEVVEADTVWREAKGQLDKLKSQKNKESKAIAEVKKSGGDIKAQIAKVREVSEAITAKNSELKILEDARDKILTNIPNILDPQVPTGADDEENTLIRYHLEKPTFDFKVRNHQELCEMNGWYDMEVAAKASGSRFYYTMKELVLLEFALYNFVMNKLNDKGYTPVMTPPMLRREVLGKSVSLDAFEEDIYKIEGEDLYLIATSEHTLAALHMDDVISHKDLPIKYAGFSNCFRKEAGVTKDSKGIFRVHNFNKIEQFVFCKPEDSDKLHDEITANAEEIFKDLEVHYQIVDICSGDIGSMATRKFDLEAWLPSQEKYREMVSASNYRDYGARRLNCKYQTENGSTELVHTGNSTAIALTRCMITILEQHQTEDGNVRVPVALRPYLGGREFLIQR
ncbi:MAG: serine--tRNA ligase [Nanoarchaeales archaeon]|nr:serine--tRNA ligase [Nanoarchaeales archaeon]